MQQSVTVACHAAHHYLLPTIEEALVSLRFSFFSSLSLFPPALQEKRETDLLPLANDACRTQTRWGRLVCSFKFYFGAGAAAIETGRTAPYRRPCVFLRPTLVRFTVDDGTKPKFSHKYKP